MKLPAFVTEQLALSNLLEPILSYLRRIMKKPSPSIQTQNIVCVPIGSPSQNWHYDHTENAECINHLDDNHSYFTILINLSHLDENCGGTELWNKKSQRNELVSHTVLLTDIF